MNPADTLPPVVGPPPVVPSAAAEVYFCANRNRRAVVLTTPTLNGIDFLEVASAADETLLLLTFLRDPSPLAKSALHRLSFPVVRALRVSRCCR